MRARAAALVCLLATSGALAGCGRESPSRGAQPGTGAPTARTTETAPTARSGDPAGQDGQLASGSGPPAIVVHAPGGDLTAHPGSYCWTVGEAGQCADTVLPELAELPRLSDDDGVRFTFPLSGFTFQADFSPLESIDPDGDGCFRTRTTVLAPGRDGEFTLRPMGPAGSYVVSLFGEGPQGDLVGTFVWTTSRPGPEPTPTASVGIVSYVHGEVDGSHGLNLSVSGLARTPKEATATVTSTSANGKSVTLDAGRPSFGCPASGSVTWWESDASRSRQVAGLGPAPFTYDIRLVLDGVSYHATATWPDDHVSDPFNDDPAPVPLDFDPPLPRVPS